MQGSKCHLSVVCLQNPLKYINDTWHNCYPLTEKVSHKPQVQGHQFGQRSLCSL